jgi:hypothetical protein
MESRPDFRPDARTETRQDAKTTFCFEAGSVRFELSGTEDFVRRNLPALMPFVSQVIALGNTPAPVAAPAVAPATNVATNVATTSAVAATPAIAAPATPAAAPAETPKSATPDTFTGWWGKYIGVNARISMQDSILLMALYKRVTSRETVFTSEDIRRGFESLGQPEPKSLLQILGTLKRDHNLILGTDRRGAYELSASGIERARQLASEK